MLTLSDVQTIIGIAMTTNTDVLENVVVDKVPDMSRFRFKSVLLHNIRAYYVKNLVHLSYIVEAEAKEPGIDFDAGDEVTLSVGVLFNKQCVLSAIKIAPIASFERDHFSMEE